MIKYKSVNNQREKYSLKQTNTKKEDREMEGEGATTHTHLHDSYSQYL